MSLIFESRERKGEIKWFLVWYDEEYWDSFNHFGPYLINLVLPLKYSRKDSNVLTILFLMNVILEPFDRERPEAWGSVMCVSWMDVLQRKEKENDLESWDELLGEKIFLSHYWGLLNINSFWVCLPNNAASVLRTLWQIWEKTQPCLVGGSFQSFWKLILHLDPSLWGKDQFPNAQIRKQNLSNACVLYFHSPLSLQKLKWLEKNLEAIPEGHKTQMARMPWTTHRWGVQYAPPPGK